MKKAPRFLETAGLNVRKKVRSYPHGPDRLRSMLLRRECAPVPNTPASIAVRFQIIRGLWGVSYRIE